MRELNQTHTESVLLTVTWSVLCDHLDQIPDMDVKCDIWAEPGWRSRSADSSPLLLCPDCSASVQWGQMARLLSCPFGQAWSKRLNYEMERWFEFSMNASKDRPERNVCCCGLGV